MQELKELQDTPQVLNTSGESLNPMSASSKLLHHGGCGCNRKGSMSAHSVFVLHKDGTPLTPTKPSKARKLMEGKVAKPVWNKFSQFGIQMLVDTRRNTPNTALGIDNGTSFEGYSLVCGTENHLNVMWKLPDKKKIVRKLNERRQLRRARRWRNCRRRPARFDNREKQGFMAPSQLVMVNSRLKAIKEFLKTYPINVVGIEDVRFNHAKFRYGKNFSTIEIGKARICEFLESCAKLYKFAGHQTQKLRKAYGYDKTSANKASEKFVSHCSDSLALAVSLTINQHVHRGKFIIVDDSYRPVRRKLHDSQFSEGHIRYPYSQGNFVGIRKGTVCKLGTICGGTKDSAWIYDWNHYRIGKSLNRMGWLSKRFPIKEERAEFLHPASGMVSFGSSGSW
jgi:Holliday junction resolvasome RuvABC endonuclease subunit